ncbi:MAG: ABC transporter substrate-binding protein [Thermoproteota archaeon]|nr:ABC transporter substrate-binding protein [Thermoproteota archaeon]
MRTILCSTAVIGLLLFGVFLNTHTGVSALAPTKGAYVDQVRFIQYLDGNVGLQDVKSGNLNAYFFRIPLEAVSTVKNDPNLKEYDRIGGSFGLLLNPAPSKDNNSINPFQFKQVRFAMNYLVDRGFVVNEILKGYGTPMIDPFGVYSPEYLNVLDTVESLGFRYNPQVAEKMISGTLTKAGANNQAGKWFFKGNPVTIKILIRSDDLQRLSMGELVASELQNAGFSVQKNYGDLNKANSVVSGSDPRDFQWQVYTEAYAGTSAFVKYNPIVTSQMYAPYYGNMPGGQNPTFWNYRNATLDNLTQRIAFFKFASQQERNELVRNATKAGIQESVRIFVAQNIEPFVASSTLKGLVNDFGAGITSKFSLVNAVTQKSSNTLDIGVKQIYQGAWNNVEGCKDVYCTEIYSAISDGPTFRNPYTGEVIPMREQWTDISTNGPTGKLKVAPDALFWDPFSQHWKSVGENGTSKSKVTYKILYSNWHNGIPIDKSDFLYTQYFLFQWGTNTGKGDLTVDPEFRSQAQVAIPLIKGIRFVGNDKVESYIDQWHYDNKEIADAAAIWPSEPWEITAATERLVTSGKLAYSRGEATANNVDWLSLLIPTHAQMIKTELQKMKEEGYVPAALKGNVTVADAIKRYDASMKWITDHNNAVIGNGAFYLDSYNPAGGIIIIKAFRDPSYPFPQGSWSSFESPKLANIQSVNAPPFLFVGQPSIIHVAVNIGGAPSNNALVNYFISNKDDKVVLQGVAQPVANGNNNVGTYNIILRQNDTSKFSVGPNTFKIFANSKEAFRPDIHVSTLLGIPTVAAGRR